MLATHATASATTIAPFAQEFQALKDELQRTLARLSVADDVRHAPASPWSQASSVATTTTTCTPTSVRSDVSAERGRRSPAQGDTSRILHELVATARRRRQVEVHLARELERDLQTRGEQEPLGAERIDARDERNEAIQREIEALRLRRKHIMHMIDVESRDDAAQNAQSSTIQRNDRYEDQPSSNQRPDLSASIKQNIQGEYSIEGIVKLGGSLELSSIPVSSRPTAHIPRSGMSYHRNTPHVINGQYQHDMMQDVFAIQLKFAETMLQLEKSIQVRDHLLVPSTQSRRPPNRRRNAPTRRRSRPPSTIHEDMEMDPADSSGEDQGTFPQSSSDEASLSEDTMRLWRPYRPDCQRTPPHRPVANMGESIATTTASTTPESQPSPVIQEENTLSTPSRTSPGDEGLVTPTTNDSSGKQVRFDEAPADEYPTPQIARNISFDQASIDSSEEDSSSMRYTKGTRQCQDYRVQQKQVVVVSSDDEALSFMGGSSVCSADLDDESFLIAFNALRTELQREQYVPAKSRQDFPRSPQQLPTEQQPVKTDAAQHFIEPSREVQHCENINDLMKRKRGLALAIQSTTAKLVLAADGTHRDQLARTLDGLRRELQHVEAKSLKPPRRNASCCYHVATV